MPVNKPAYGIQCELEGQKWYVNISLSYGTRMHTISFNKAQDAETVSDALNTMYERGYNDAKKEIREALGVGEAIETALDSLNPRMH